MRKLFTVLSAGFLAASMGVAGVAAVPTQANAADVLIGSCIYKFDDTFMSGVRSNMNAAAKKAGADLEIVDSQNRQPLQNDQVDTYITKGVNALIVNPVDRTAAKPLLEKARAAGLPIIFINREPDADILNSYDKAWYVGARAEESGTISGQIIVDFFKANPTADRNKDGKVQYIMLKGEQGHQDASLRTEYSVKAIKDAGLGVDEVGSDNANWDKVLATDKMKGFIASVGLQNIEAVLANNDDMALGALEALKAEGYNTGDPTRFIPVVGVDATAPALEAMDKGGLSGTALNDAANQGAAAVMIAISAASGKPVDKASTGYDVTDGKYVWIPYVKVTKENMADFKK